MGEMSGDSGYGNRDYGRESNVDRQLRELRRELDDLRRVVAELSRKLEDAAK